MPIAEPSTELNLWPRVRAITGWPDNNEEAVRALGESWSRGGEQFATAAEQDLEPLTGSWSDPAGQQFLARATATLDKTLEVSGAMTFLGEKANGFAQVITDVKNAIRDLIEQNLPLFGLAASLPPGVRELAEEIFVRLLAALVAEQINQGAARAAALGTGSELDPLVAAQGEDQGPSFLDQAANAGKEALNSLASLGNAAVRHPEFVLSGLAGARLAALGVAGVTGGGVISLSGVGAIGGVPAMALSATAIVAGAGLTAASIGALTQEAMGDDRVTPFQVNSGHQGYHPAPKTLPGVPDAVRARRKTPVQGGGALRERWVDRKGKIYEWDKRHGEVEVYDKRGNHQGVIDPNTGAKIKDAIPGRKVEK